MSPALHQGRGGFVPVREEALPRDEPSEFTFSAQDPREQIDYVFASGDLTVVSAERQRTATAVRASDHLPVLAVLELGP